MLNTTTSDLCSGLIRFRQLIADGHDPESAFLLTHDPMPDENISAILANTSASIARAIEQAMRLDAVLERADAALADTLAVLTR